MIIEVKRAVEVEVKYVKLEVAVRYDEEDIPNDFPARKNDLWTAIIELETGNLLLDGLEPFPFNVTEDMYMKVCDEGEYTLLDNDGCDTGIRHEGYVPGFFPGEHYGDYLILNIANGRVSNWNVNQSELEEAFSDEQD